MSTNNMPGTILIKENTLLPEGVAVESETLLPGWRVVRNLDGCGLRRKIEEAKWNFFYLVGVIRATVLGRNRPATLRRAVKRILAKQQSEFNSLEIAEVISKRFLGIPFVSVAAHSRHIQQDICLVPSRDSVLRMSASAVPGTAVSDAEGHHAEVITKQYTALISSP